VTGRYAGSPIPIDFGELNEQKSVVLVEAEPGRPAKVIAVPISGGRLLRRFHGTLEELASEAPHLDGLCSLTIRTPARQPDLSDRVRELLPSAVLLEVIEESADRIASAVAVSAEEEETRLDALFREYLADRRTKTSAAQVSALFAELLRDLENEQPIHLAALDPLIRLTSEEGATVTQLSSTSKEGAP
jgi:exonuclease SbcD